MQLSSPITIPYMSKKTREYYCNCSEYCKGCLVKVSRSTYHRHSLHRSAADNPPPSNTQEFSADFQKFLGTLRVPDSVVIAPPAPIASSGCTTLLKRPIGLEASEDPTLLKRRRAAQPEIEILPSPASPASPLEEGVEILTEVCTCRLS